MLTRQQLVRSGAVLAIALAIGHIMQHGAGAGPDEHQIVARDTPLPELVLGNLPGGPGHR
ncbi:MAG: hypothetical protein WDA25_09180 [Paracoccaceae bacterium]